MIQFKILIDFPLNIEKQLNDLIITHEIIEIIPLTLNPGGYVKNNAIGILIKCKMKNRDNRPL
jgi:hypothetical protein